MVTDAPSPPFRARYDGVCAADCGNRIHPGDTAQYVEGQLVHHGCVPDEKPEPEPRPVCSTCFMEIALNGACQCES